VYFPSGSQFLITYSVADTNGNAFTGTRGVTLRDRTLPVVTVVGNTRVTLEYMRLKSENMYQDLGAIAVDSLDGDISSYYSRLLGRRRHCFHDYVYGAGLRWKRWPRDAHGHNY
jgi:hypothetical protein